MASEQITRRTAHRNCEIENSQNSSALFFGKKINHKSWSDGGEYCFPNPHQRVSQQQFTVSMRESRQQSQSAPQCSSHRNHPSPRKSVGQWAGEWGCQHVATQKCAGQKPQLGL